MSKVIRIEEALLQISPEDFERLADEYLHLKGYEVTPIGRMAGKNKVTKGTPDTILGINSDIKIFAEYSTEERKGLCKKFSSDINKCLNEEKTGIVLQEIEKIIFCHNSTALSNSDRKTLEKLTEPHGIKLELYDVGTISLDINNKYPSLARDHLGITIDTGQILKPKAFVKQSSNHKLSTPLDTKFLSREEELKNALGYLKSTDMLIVSGPPGTGKTRFSLELLQSFKTLHPEYKEFCILNKGNNLFDDIKDYFPRHKNLIVLVDDANRLGGQFSYLEDLILEAPETKNIKIIATVRGYALNDLLEPSKLSNISNLTLANLDQDSIKNLIKTEFKLTHPQVLEKIYKISKGNPRLALMMASIIKRKGNAEVISKAEEVFKEYFEPFLKQQNILSDPELIKAAGIISFYRAIDRKNTSQNDEIQNKFGCNPEKIWESLELLEKAEIVEIHEGLVAKVSDQILATYLFYLCFFKKHHLPIEGLLNNFIYSHRMRVMDCLVPAVSLSHQKIQDMLTPIIEKMWDDSIQAEKHDEVYTLAKSFGPLIDSKVAIYIRDQLDGMPDEIVDYSVFETKQDIHGLNDYPLLDIISSLAKDGDTTFIDLACIHTQKKYAALHVAYLFKKYYGLTTQSTQDNFETQFNVLSTISKHAQGSTNTIFKLLYISVATDFISFRHVNYTSEKMTLYRQEFWIPSTPKLMELRTKIWGDLSFFSKEPLLSAACTGFFSKYIKLQTSENSQELMQQELKQVINFIEAGLSASNLEHCILVHDFKQRLDNLEVSYSEDILSKFYTEDFELYKFITSSFVDSEFESSDEFDIAYRQEIKKFIGGLSTENYNLFIDKAGSIYNTLQKSQEFSRNLWQFEQNMSSILCSIGDQSPLLFEKVMEQYFKVFNPIRAPHELINKMIQALGETQALQLIKKAPTPTCGVWQLRCLECIAEDTFKEDLETILGLYKTLPPNTDWRVEFSLLQRFEEESTAILQVCRILMHRVENKEISTICFHGLFDTNIKVATILDWFKNDPALLEKIYLAIMIGDQRYLDHDGRLLKALLSRRKEFIMDLMGIYYSDNHSGRSVGPSNYDFIWDLNEADKIVTMAIEFVLDKEKAPIPPIGQRMLRVYRHFTRPAFKNLMNPKQFINWLVSIVKSFSMYQKNQSYYSSSRKIRKLFNLGDNKKPSQPATEKQIKFVKQLIHDKNDDLPMMELIFNVIAHHSEEVRLECLQSFLQEHPAPEAFKRIPLFPSDSVLSGSRVPEINKEILFLQKIKDMCSSTELLEHKIFLEGWIKSNQSQIALEKKRDFMSD